MKVTGSLSESCEVNKELVVNQVRLKRISGESCEVNKELVVNYVSLIKN
jgi:hypothetical protein